MARRFDLSTLGPNTRQEADEAASFIRGRFTRDIAEIGARLAAVKEALPHGAFGPWVVSALSITPRSAQNYMNAAAFLAGKSEAISHLPPVLIYRLSAPTADEEVVRRVLAAADAGERLDARAIASDLLAAAVERRSRERMEKRTDRQRRKRGGR